MAKQVQVSVDRDFARVGSKSYAINKINSVEMRQRYPNGTAPMFLCGLVALAGLIMGANGGGAPAITLVVIFAPLAYWMWRRSRVVEYQLFLMTSSSEAQAIQSLDRGFIETLRDQIESAMVGHAT